MSEDTEKAQLYKAIEACKKTIETVKKQHRREGFLTVSYALGSTALGILAVLFSNLAGIITTIGVGGLGFAAHYQTVKRGITTYFLDPMKLNSTVAILEAEIETCTVGDHDCLKRVMALIRTFLEELGQRARVS